MGALKNMRLSAMGFKTGSSFKTAGPGFQLGANLNQDPIPDYTYDVVILGAGGGGIGAAYALKDSGLDVVLVDKNEQLGGTHLVAGVNTIIATPVNPFFKDIVQAIDTAYTGTVADSDGIGTGTDFEKGYRSSLFYDFRGNLAKEYPTKTINKEIKLDTVYTDTKYKADLNGKVDLFLQCSFISATKTSGDCKTITVYNAVEDKNEVIAANCFIDCSGDGWLCKDLGNNYLVGGDARIKYNEDTVLAEYVANQYDINTVELAYNLGSGTEDLDTFPDVEGVDAAVNNIHTNPITGSPAQWISPSYHAAMSRQTLIESGIDASYAEGLINSKGHWKVRKTTYGSPYVYDSPREMLGIREGYRVECDETLVQSDIETRMVSANLASQEIIALATWWADSHQGYDMMGYTPITDCFGISYGSIIPSGLKNVFIASRGFGVSHVAASAARLTKTMMMLGHAAGHAAKQYINSSLTDIRNVSISTLQTDIGIAPLMTEIETYFYNDDVGATSWTIDVVGVASATQGTMVISATEDITPTATGDVTIGITREDDGIYRKHTITVDCAEGDSGTIVFADKSKIISLGNHNGSSNPNIGFYSIPTTVPQLSCSTYTIPQGLLKINITLNTRVNFKGVGYLPKNLVYISAVLNRSDCNLLPTAPAAFTGSIPYSCNYVAFQYKAWSYNGKIHDNVEHLRLDYIEWTCDGSLPLNVEYLRLVDSSTGMDWTGLDISGSGDMTYLNLDSHRTTKYTSADMVTLLTSLTDRVGDLPSTITINEYEDYASPPQAVLDAKAALIAAKSTTTVNLGA